jgi:2-polyprenyl-6-methoxyphenol hydroxylase-like FAD-dependent oxidoreductase
MQPGAEAVAAKIGQMEKYSMGYPIAHTEWMIAREIETRARFVVGADGYHSFVRRRLGADFEHVGTAEAFSVFEFQCDVDFPDEARLVLGPDTTNVYWPMGGGRGRWSFQVDPQQPAPPRLSGLLDLIGERASWFPQQIEEVLWTTTVMFERRLVDRFGKDRIWLAGDAAHITGPVGAQSMNVGLREAHELARLVSAACKDGVSAAGLARYGDERRSEWRGLLGLEGTPQAAEGARPWPADRAARMLPCIPESGPMLRELLDQIGLRFA